jgi:hypothetical protein
MLSHKKAAFLLIILLASVVSSAVIPLGSPAFGNITINSKTSSTPGQSVVVGGNVSLYFENVAWAGEYFNLFMSLDGSTSISSGDVVYSPSFYLYNLTDTAKHSYRTSTGNWTVGSYWVNGTISPTIPVGNYYIKVFDQVASTVAVTDTYISVYSTLSSSTLVISPASGPGGVTIKLSGSGYSPNDQVAISYLDPFFGTWNPLTTVTANASGKISYTSQAPDLSRCVGNDGDYDEMYNAISYRTQINGVTYGTANYNEMARGIKTVGSQTAYGLFGNGTNLASVVKVMTGDKVTLSGKYFHPGDPVYLRWDSTSVVGTVTSDEWSHATILNTTAAASPNGTFTTTITVPTCDAGEHYIAIEDTQTRMSVKIFVSTATLTLTPSYGPGGVSATLSGSRYPANKNVTIEYYDDYYGVWNYWNSTMSNSGGIISCSFKIPDLHYSQYTGDSGDELATALSFRTSANGALCSYVEFNQYHRGIKQVGTAVAYGLFGNGTDLSSSVMTNVGSTIPIIGKWFHPGVVYVKFDGKAVVGTVTSDGWRTANIIGTTTASSTNGSFQVNVIIPQADEGIHYLAIEDTETLFALQIYVLPGVNPTPTPSPLPTPTPTPTPPPTPTPSPSSGGSGNNGTSPTPTSPPVTNLPTPNIEVSGRGDATNSVFNVELSGRVDLNGGPLANTLVHLYYMNTGGDSWISLTTVTTSSNGAFTALWHPQATGSYQIKATVAATSSYLSGERIIDLVLVPGSSENLFSISSNSTISQFAFNSTSHELTFTASGPSHTTGYIQLYIPKSLVSDITTLRAYIDGNPTTFTSESQDGAWLITFQYSHSQHTITLQIGASAAPTAGLDTIQLVAVASAAAVAVVAISVVLLKRKKNVAIPATLSTNYTA